MTAARFRLGTCLVLVLVAVLAGGAQQAGGVPSPNLVISQIYGGGGNALAPYTNDYIELFNRGSSAVSLAGLSVQYASATGTGFLGANSGQLTELPSVSLDAGQYFLVQEAGGTVGVALPTPDLTDATAINMSATGGKVALVSGITSLGCNGSSGQPCDATALARVVDLIGYDGANYSEGAPAPTLSNTSAAFRAGGGCTDTDTNSTDFSAAAPAPRNSASLRNPCGSATPTSPTASALTAPLSPSPGTLLTVSVLVTPGTNPASTGLTVACDLSWLGLGPSAPLFDDGTHGDPTAGDLTFTVQATIPSGTVPGMRVGTCNVVDAESRTGATTYSVNVVPGVTDTGPTVAGTLPVANATHVATDANVTITFSEAVEVAGSWYSISCASSGAHTASVTGGPQSFLLNPASDFAAGESCTVTVVAVNVTDQDTTDPPDAMASDYLWSFTTLAPPTQIHDIQGAAHISPRNGQIVAGVGGIVTAKRTNGFYMQDPSPDADSATSEGIFVFTSSAPSVSVGDSVRVNGRVTEFRPGGASTGNLATTEIGTPSIAVLSTGNPLPAATVLGTGGRIPPDTVIEDDAGGNVETGGTFDPANDGIDFYESVEGMRVQLNDAVAVGPTNSFGETPVIADDGAHSSVRTARGGILLRPNDANPERIIADDVITSLPSLHVGDGYTGPLVGVVDYNFGNFFLEVTQGVDRVDRGLQREITDAPTANELAVATFNFENLDTGDPQSKVDALAHEVVDNLRSPDLISGQEVQDNNGPTNNGTVDANGTLDMLVGRIESVGGPHYEYRYVNPVDNQDGGEPGGNIRQVFLFRTDRGLSFVNRPGGTSTSSTGVTGSGSSTELTFSPGRIDPTNAAFNSSRKPLAGEFSYRGQKLFVIANHFNSKGGDDPLFGRFQPPTRSSETQRHQQAHIVADFVSQLAAADSDANVMVLGDLNDFEFSETVDILKAAGMKDLMETLPVNQRYSYEFEGNAQVLDHILVGQALFSHPLVFDPVHVNAEFFDQASDHDPSVVRILFDQPPSGSAGGPYAVDEGSSVTVMAGGSDPEGGPLQYAWDLDNDGTFETPGQTVAFSATGIDGPATRTIAVRVTDDGGLSVVSSTTVAIANVAPVATFNAPGSSPAGFPFALSLTSPHDPSAADTSAGFTYAFDCGSGYGAFSLTAVVSCPTTDVGARLVGGKIRDKDGGISEYRSTVSVAVTFSSLCDLVRLYSTDPKVTDDLCDKLARAAAASTAALRAAQLNAFANQVDAKTGKGLTPAQAAELKLLASRL